MSNMYELVEMSNRYGGDEEFVLAGGGNTSYKEDGVLYVKGSGVPLSDIQPEQFVAMDIKKLLEMVEREYPQIMNNAEKERKALDEIMAARLPGEEEKRPSIESVLHAMFPYKFVLHVHPPLINGLTCSVNGKAACGELFRDEAVWIDLTKPGLILAQTCNRAFNSYIEKKGNCPQIVLLQNHGIFISADTVTEIDKLMEYVVDKIADCVMDKDKPDFQVIAFAYNMEALQAVSTALKSLYTATGKSLTLFCTNKQVSTFVKDKNAFKPVSRAFTPDHIVYYKDEPLFIESNADITDAFAAYTAKKGFKPKIVAVQEAGFFALSEDKKTAEKTQALFLDAIKIATYAKTFGGENPPGDEFARFILNWEVDAYRSKL